MVKLYKIIVGSNIRKLIEGNVFTQYQLHNDARLAFADAINIFVGNRLEIKR